VPWLLIRDDQEQWPVGMVGDGAEIVWRNWAALGTHTEQRSQQRREIDGLTEHVCEANGMDPPLYHRPYIGHDGVSGNHHTKGEGPQCRLQH
jgi:hypothetical protein